MMPASSNEKDCRDSVQEAETSSSVTTESTSSSLSLQVAGYDEDLVYDEKEARKARLKVDLCIMPFLMLLFCFLQFDRTNIANALTDTFAKDIRVTNKEINIAQTLFTTGFIVTELPFNLISKVMGPERFLPITMFVWGTITWTQMFLKGPSGFYAARFFVGALEGGYIPGMAVYISKYYTNQELALRFAFFWASNSIAGALSGPLAIGLISLKGKASLAGWQWLFLIEGVLTCLLAVIAYFYLPHSAARPKEFFGVKWNLFTQKEASVLVTRVIRSDPSKAHRQGKPVLLSHIVETFRDWRLYGHIVAAFLSMMMIAPMNTYAPSIIKSLGFTGLQANGLSSIGSVCALLLSISLAYSSDRFFERGFHIMVGYLWGAVGLLWLALAPSHVNKWTLWGGVVWTQMGMGSAQAINAAWLTSNMSDYKRPIALAAYVMSIQLANFPGNQLFRQQDAPRYRRGLIIAASCVIAGAAVISILKLCYRLVDGGDNKRLSEKSDASQNTIQDV